MTYLGDYLQSCTDGTSILVMKDVAVCCGMFNVKPEIMFREEIKQLQIIEGFDQTEINRARFDHANSQVYGHKQKGGSERETVSNFRKTSSDDL